jgi:two-component system, NtrC family, response regulator AtoC
MQVLVITAGAELDSLSELVQKAGHVVRTADGAQAIEEYLRDRPDLVLVDVGDAPGMDVLRLLQLEDPAALMVAVSGSSSVDEAVQAVRAGAAEYLPLPLAPDRLELFLTQVLEDRRQHAQLSYLRARDARGAELESLVGSCAAMRQVVDTIQRVARRTVSSGAPTILVLGETGTGKGCIARAIHYNGRRREGPFVEVNCAAIPDALLEGELFGHEKGAYTDARTPRVGLMETAHGGTLFLDELGCLPLTAQTKLLTFLEDKVIRRLGSSVDRHLDVQVVAASNRDLAAMAEQETFRTDLLHRLQVVTITLPPLRDRGADRVVLADYFLAQLSREYGQPQKRLTTQAVAVVESYAWPGNVRELRNTLERVVLLEDDPLVRPEHLHLQGRTRAPRVSPMELRLPPDGFSLDELERRVIDHAMRVCQGNVSRAARYLRISRQTLRYRLKSTKLGANKDV